MDLPRSFLTIRGDVAKHWAIELRESLPADEARPLLEQVASVEWGAHQHAYGPATDVPAQLAAVIVGDDATREEAWWNLWGNVHHQGTIYAATVPAASVLLGLAAWPAYPDRVEALALLREIGAAEGVVVGHDAADEVLLDEQAQQRLFAELRATLTDGASRLSARWETGPDDVRRGLLWLLSVLPELRAQRKDLVRAVLPDEHRRAWELATAGRMGSDADADAVWALEEWVRSAG